MGVFSGPDLSENGLVLALDAGNQKSLNIPSQADHGYADWYCFVTGTATYSIINSSGGTIFERTGSTVVGIATTTGPGRGTFTVTAGRTYYGSVPVNLVVEDQQHSIAPLTMVGTQFWSVAVRNNPSTYYVYSPYQSATVNFYDNSANGLVGIATSTITVNVGGVGTFTSNNLTNHWISSNVPIIASTTQTGVDRTILSPMSTYVYQRFQSYLKTTNNTTPTNNNSYVTYDSTYKVMNMSIADGAGGDCAQGLGLEYLSDTYSWGNVVSDYTIVFPYTATVTTSYWNGSAWVVWDTHSNIAGSITNPPRVAREGTNGSGVEATVISGAAANMASGATLWKWEGTSPFYLAINDSADDEFSVLGWLSARNTTPRSSNIITDITGRGNNGTLTNGPVFTLGNGGSLSFDGTNDYVDTGKTATQLGVYDADYTFDAWVYPTNLTSDKTMFGTDQAATRQGLHLVFRGSSIYQGHYGADFSAGSATLNAWNNISYTYVKSSGLASIYKNGVLQGSGTINSFIGTTSILIGRWASGNNFIGNGSQYKIYNRALTATEVQQNFNATRGRYGI